MQDDHPLGLRGESRARNAPCISRVESLWWHPHGREHPFITCQTSTMDDRNVWFLPPDPDWWMDRMCLDVAQPAGNVSLRWLIYSAVMEGAPYGMSMSFNPPRHDDPPTLNFFRYCIATVDSRITQCHDVPGDHRPTSGREWLHYWFHMRFTSTSLNSMVVLALRPTANMLMCLKFQSTLLQNPGWLESPEWQH